MKVVAIGECMIEINRHDDGRIEMKYAGDTLNALVYLARAAESAVTPFYMTALGNDPFSDAMIAEWRAEKIDARYVRRLDGQLPGLYVIDNDAAGERHVFYWRANAAVRRLFADDDDLLASLDEFDLVYVSGISLAVLPASLRDRLVQRLSALRGKTAIAFDPNFRPQLWPRIEDARALFATMYRLADFLLVSIEDAERCYADPVRPDATTSAEDVLAFFCSQCDGEIVLRRGARSCLIHHGRMFEVPALPAEQIDATGAGDAFNGTYLACRLKGQSARQAAVRAHEVAAAVVQVKGAIIPRESS